ncbi:MAG: ATP-binding protein [Acetobacteraceae bacterium]
MRVTCSIHGYVTILVLGTVVPFLLFCALLVDQAAKDQQKLIAETIHNTASGAADDLSRQLGTLQALALALANSRALQSGDLATFHDQASELLRRQKLTAVLREPNGQQVVNTAVTFGTPLPSDPADSVRLPDGDTPAITGLTRDPLTDRRVVSIVLPVMNGDAVAYLLSLEISSVIAAVMQAQLVPSEQVVGLVDQQGTIIYRTREPEQVIGLKAPAAFLSGIAAGDEGSFASQSRAGVPVYVAFSRIKPIGWTLAVSIPRQVLFEPVQQSLVRLLALGSGTLVLAGLIAWLVGRAIARPVVSLSRLAAALGSGEHIGRPPATWLREVNDVASSMLGEAERLRAQTARQQRNAAALRSEIASRRRIEQQLIQSQKMEAVGQLTGGLAHDFNNLLAIIIGNLDMLGEHLNGDPEVNELTGGAVEAALRGAELTRQMLAFARRQPLAPERHDINEVIRTFVRLLRRTLGEAVAIELQLAADVRLVLVDRVQFEAAITNLATNARDAMPDGGRLVIATRNTSLDEDYAAAHAEVVPGNYVLVEISDKGSGMTPAVLARIFEPFFTTKEPGRGTGLGLSMVFGFMKQSGGHVTAYSEIGEGTTFRLYLPPAPDTAVAALDADASPPRPGQNETILAVEDSTGLRQILARQLASAGYCVLQASDARHALATITGDSPIDLLITDIVMPGGMNGRELARVAVQHRPGLRTLLTTGFSDADDDVEAQGLRILRKPYRKEDLLRCVRAVLDD